MDLRIDYSATDTVGKTVKSHAEEFRSLLGEIHNQNENLKSHWQGADAQSYTNKISEQEQVMNELQKTIDQIGDYLIKVSAAYKKAMEENTIK